MSLSRPPHVVDNVVHLRHAGDYYETSWPWQAILRNPRIYGQSPLLHPGCMSETVIRRREAFRDFVKTRGGVAAVARAAGVKPSTLYSYLDGKSASLLDRTTSPIATAFDVPLEQLFGDERPLRQVPIVYYVGAGAEVYSMQSAEAFDYVEGLDNATPLTVAGKIQGSSMGSMFDGWLVFWDEQRAPVTSDLLGEVCIVALHDDRILVKRIEASRTPGLFHLMSNTEPPMLDVPVLWAARVTGMKPR